MACSLRPSNDLPSPLFVFRKVEAACSKKCSKIDSVELAVDSEIWINSDPDLLEEVASEKALSPPLRYISRASGVDGKPLTSFVSFGLVLSEGRMLDFLGCQPFLVLKGTDNLSEVINKCHCLPWSVRLFKKKLPGGDSSLGCNPDDTQLILSEGWLWWWRSSFKIFRAHVSSSNEKRDGKEVVWSFSGTAFLYQYPGTFIPRLHPRKVELHLIYTGTGASILAGSFTFLGGQEKSISALKCINVIGFGWC